MPTAAPDTWMPLWIGPYLANTLHLTTRQHGAYMLLIMACWKAGGTLSGGVSSLKAITRLSPQEWAKDRDTLAAFFDVADGVWAHPRVLEELNKARAFQAQRSGAGKASAEARKAQRKVNENSTTVATEPQRQVKTSPSPSQDIEERKKEESLSGELAFPEPDLALPLPLDRTSEGQALKLWNEAAQRTGLPTAQRLTDTRRRALRQRLSECGGLDGWQSALAKVEHSRFLTGKTERTNGHENWRCDLDFILREQKFTKLMEGGFDDTPRNADSDRSTAATRGIDAAFARRSVRTG